MLPPFEKWKKIIDAILKMLLPVVVVLIVSCNMLYSLKLRICLKNKDFPNFKENPKKYMITFIMRRV